MQVSVETTSNIERRMTIGVPAQEIDQAVQKRLQETARTVRLNLISLSVSRVTCWTRSTASGYANFYLGMCHCRG